MLHAERDHTYKRRPEQERVHTRTPPREWYNRCIILPVAVALLSMSIAMQENVALFNHTFGSLAPNYIFDVMRDPSGAIKTAFTYACLGKIPPLIGPQAFSFNVLSRSSNVSVDEIRDIILSVNASTFGQLDMSGMRINDAEAYQSCGVS